MRTIQNTPDHQVYAWLLPRVDTLCEAIPKQLRNPPHRCGLSAMKGERFCNTHRAQAIKAEETLTRVPQ